MQLAGMNIGMIHGYSLGQDGLLKSNRAPVRITKNCSPHPDPIPVWLIIWEVLEGLRLTAPGAANLENNDEN